MLPPQEQGSLQGQGNLGIRQDMQVEAYHHLEHNQEHYYNQTEKVTRHYIVHFQH